MWSLKITVGTTTTERLHFYFTAKIYLPDLDEDLKMNIL